MPREAWPRFAGKKHLVSLSALLTVLGLAFAPLALAHEHQTFQIGDKQYIFTVGSLNEPVAVDDKSGVDLNVTTTGAPVTGLEKTLQVEVSAGSQKRTFDLKAVFGKEGSYYATFYPTVQTTYAYRFFGTVNNIPVDLTFTCLVDTSLAQAEDMAPVKLSDQLSRIHKAGAFGCPAAKADLGFPEKAITNNELVNQIQNSKQTGSTNGLAIAIAALALSVVGIVMGGRAVAKKP